MWMVETPVQLSLVRNDTGLVVQSFALNRGVILDGEKKTEKELIQEIVRHFKSYVLVNPCRDGFTAFAGDLVQVNNVPHSEITPLDLAGVNKVPQMMLDRIQNQHQYLPSTARH